jgi:urease accessory protein
MRDHEHSNIAGVLGVTLVTALLLASQPAVAHIVDGSAANGFLGGFAHPLFGLDHVAAMVAVGLWGAFLGSPAIWLLPITFPMVMAVGGAIAILGVGVPGVEIGIASSAIASGHDRAGGASSRLSAALVWGRLRSSRSRPCRAPPGTDAVAFSVSCDGDRLASSRGIGSPADALARRPHRRARGWCRHRAGRRCS